MRNLLAALLVTAAISFALPGVSHAGSPGGPYTTSAISVSPNPTNPGTTVTATSTHQILGLPPQGDQIQFLIFLSGTSGNGTLSIGTSSLPGGTCTLEAATSRQWTCTYPSNAVSVGDTVTLTAPVNVSAATPTPGTFGLEGAGRILPSSPPDAAPVPDSFDQTELAIEASQPSTSTSTSTSTTTTSTTTTTVLEQTTTVPVSTAAPTTAAPTTAGSGTSPGLPATGNETGWMALFGLVALVVGLVAVGSARRPLV